MFKLALVQMRVVGGHKKENLARAKERIEEAARNGAQVILLPEALPFGWTDPSAKAAADQIPEGAACSELRSLAQKHRVYICSGLIERAGQVIFNSAVLIGPDGHVLLHYRKLNELEIAHDLYESGDRLGVVKTPFGVFGLMICADGFANGQVVSRTLGYMGVDVILSPSAWAVPADHDNTVSPYGGLWLDNYQPVAKDFQIWIASVSNVGWITSGPWQGRKCIGCSLVIGPSGNPVARGPYGVEAETIIYVDIQPKKRPAKGEGWNRMWSELPKN